MNPQFEVHSEVVQSILHEAVKTHAPIVLTYRGSSGWAMLKSRITGVEGDGQLLLIEIPRQCGSDTVLPEAGQSVSVAFRRGHRKHVFSSMVVDDSSGGSNLRNASVLRITWPDELCELQRRLYHRTPVPRGRLIPVDLWMDRCSADELDQEPPTPADEPKALPHRGKMLDLSAGGISVELPREVRPRWREQDQLSCRFAAGPDRTPVEVTARLTHYTRQADGHVRLGLQFLGLDTCEHGREVLRQIHHTANRLQRFRRSR